MNAANILQQPFVQVALPIVIAVMLASWLQNKRFDDMNKRFDDMNGDMNRRFDGVDKRLERIEGKLDLHNERITRLEERTALVR
jgi:archaellum component FlaC